MVIVKSLKLVRNEPGLLMSGQMLFFILPKLSIIPLILF